VASFCAKCGSALSADGQFCTSCGTAAGAVAAPAQPIAAPAKSGSGTLKIILIIVAVIVGLGILGLGALGFIGYRMVKNTHVDSSGRVTMNTPAGAITTTPAENLSAADLGVEIYPGAQSTRGSMRMEMPNGSGVTGVYLTSDLPAQVLAFYQNKWGSGAAVSSFLGTTMVRVKISREEFIQVTIKKNTSPENGMTKISILHMTNNKAS
jgi:hypothetical protein